ncbi:MAG: lytic transglycosylase domain-containing protein [Oligoflexus sp.]
MWRILVFAFLLATSAKASIAPEKQTSSSSGIPSYFPRSVLIDHKVWFWELIFSQYTSQHLVIHDSIFPHVVIDVIDLDAIRLQQGHLAELDDRKLLIRFLDRYRDAARKFKARGSRAALLSPMEKRVYEAYAVEEETLRHLLSGQAEIRSQRGLKDRFDEAVKRAHLYLPHMERVFREHKVPIELTRLPFVESMFNIHARSKVGASGVWQFMPATARRFMIVNQSIDERNSPWKATRGAARLLAHNYSHLQSWPLAITAYNHGLNGMRRAVDQLKSRDMEQIIRRYRSPSFGFASRNFYTEFLAVLKIYNDRYVHLKDQVKPLDVVGIRLPKAVAMPQLVQKTPLTQQMLRDLNPCLSNGYFHSHSQRSIPKHYEIVVPKHMAGKVEKALHRL